MSFEDLKREEDSLSFKLFDRKQLKLIEGPYSYSKGKDLVVVQDSSQSYFLRIINIFDGDNLQSNSKMKEAQQIAQHLKQSDHPNIVKYKDEFLLDNCFCIMTEKCSKSLQDWFDENKNQFISRQVFVKFAKGLLEGMNYLHSKNVFLQDIQLSNIFLDENDNIKLLYFENSSEKCISYDAYKFQRQNSPEQLYYYPPEVFEQEQNESLPIQKLKISNTIEENIWSAIICLYLLSGATREHISKLTLGKETSKTQYLVEHQINFILQKIIQRNPKERPSIEKIISLFTEIEQQQCIQELDQSKHDDLFNQAKLLFEQDKYKDATALFRQLIEQDPNNDKYLAWIARSLNSSKQIEESLYWTNQSLKINSQNELAFYNLGNSHRDKRQNAKAIEYFLKVLEMNPQNDSALNNLGLAYDSEEMFKESIECYEKALLIKPNKQNAYYNLGITYYRQQNYDMAISQFKKVLELNPLYEGAFNYLGSIYYSNSNYEEAIKYFQQALKINPKERDSLYNIGICNYSLNKLNVSHVYFQKAKSVITIQDEEISFLFASNYYCKDAFEKSIKYFTQAQKLNEFNAEGSYYLKESKKKI